MNVDGIAFRVCIFFACQPDEMLTSADIVAKFEPADERVSNALKHAVTAGWLHCVPARGQGNRNTYSAGPLILRIHGMPQREAA